MGYKIGLPCIKLNDAGNKSKKCGSFKKVAEEALEERVGLDPDIDYEKTKDNIYLTEIKTAKELIEYSEKHCSELKDRSGRKIRSDAVKMIATIIKPPHALMSQLSHEEKIKLIEDGVDCLGEIIGKNNIKAAVIHTDELNYHGHVMWEPMVDGYLCAKEAFDIKTLSRINKEIPERLRAKGWSQIDDCQIYDAMEAKLKVLDRIEAYKKEHPEEEITAKRQNELYNQFKDEIIQEHRKKNGRSSFEYKNEQKKILDETIDKETEDLNRIKTEKDLLSQPEEVALSKKIAKALTEGKTSVSISTDLATHLNNSELKAQKLSEREKVISEREKSLLYKEEEFDIRVRKEVSRIIPEKDKAIKDLEHQIKVYRENETKLLHGIKDLITFMLKKLYKDKMPAPYVVAGKDYGGMTVRDAAEMMIKQLTEKIKNRVIIKSRHII